MKKNNKNSAPKRDKSQSVIIVLVLVLILMLCMIASFVIKGQTIDSLKESFKTSEERTFALEEFTTNLQPTKHRKNFVRMQLSLMYDNPKDEELIKAKTSKIRDVVLMDIKSKTADNILEAEQLELFKAELLKKINESLEKEVIKGIYLTNMMVQ